jgi:hypothetical protein
LLLQETNTRRTAANKIHFLIIQNSPLFLASFTLFQVPPPVMPITCQSHAYYIQIACHHIQIARHHIQIARHHIQIARPQHALYTPIECPSQVNTEEVEQESFLLYHQKYYVQANKQIEKQ